MADVEHSTLTGSELHEPKGVATAPLNSVYVADNAGSGSWTTLNLSVVDTNVLTARSFVDQDPAGTDTPLQVTFGGAQSGTDVDLLTDGTIQIKTEGTYLFTVTLRLTRDTTTGEALIGVRYLVNGTPAAAPTAIRLDDGAFTIPFSITFPLFAPAGTDLTVEIIRDSSGVDNGGLESVSFVAGGWSDAASASVVADRLTASF